MTASEFKVALQNASGEIIRITDWKGMYLVHYKNVLVGHEWKVLIHRLQPNSQVAWDIIEPISTFIQGQIEMYGNES